MSDLWSVHSQSHPAGHPRAQTCKFCIKKNRIRRKHPPHTKPLILSGSDCPLTYLLIEDSLATYSSILVWINVFERIFLGYFLGRPDFRRRGEEHPILSP